MNRSLRRLLAVPVLLLLLPPVAGAQEVPCAGEGELPCAFEIQELALTQTPLLFQFQTRLSQAKLPVHTAQFQTVLVQVLSGTVAHRLFETYYRPLERPSLTLIFRLPTSPAILLLCSSCFSLSIDLFV